MNEATYEMGTRAGKSTETKVIAGNTKPLAEKLREATMKAKAARNPAAKPRGSEFCSLKEKLKRVAKGGVDVFVCASLSKETRLLLTNEGVRVFDFEHSDGTAMWQLNW